MFDHDHQWLSIPPVHLGLLLPILLMGFSRSNESSSDAAIRKLFARGVNVDSPGGLSVLGAFRQNTNVKHMANAAIEFEPVNIVLPIRNTRMVAGDEFAINGRFD